MKTNFSYLEKESHIITLEQLEYIAIVTDRYEQDIRKVLSNIQYELEKANTPYLVRIDLTTIDLS
jgi:hypothetical protein